jgi:hypothetical protein
MKLTKLSAAIALSLIAASANAALTQTYDPSDSSGNTPINNGAGSSVLLAVNDQANGSANFGKTFLFALPGLTYASFINGTEGANGALSWNLSSHLGALATDTASLKWSVVAGSVLDQTNLTNLNSVSDGYPLTAVAPWGVEVTQANTGNWATGKSLGGYSGVIAQTENGIGTVGGAIDATNNSLSLLGASNNETLAPASGTGAFAYTALLPYEGIIGLGSVGFYAITNQTGLLGGADNNIVTKLGNFSLSTGDVLSYAPATSAVPLPAGAWLFLSGLCGALGLSRKSSRTSA